MPADLQSAPFGHSGTDPGPVTLAERRPGAPAGCLSAAVAPLPSAVMPSFDVVSEVDHQEVRNAVDQAQRELSTRFDFKNTNSRIEQNDLVLTLRSRARTGSARCARCSRRGS